MKKFNKTTQSIGISALAIVLSSAAFADNFVCPQPNEIQSTNFTQPSIWVAPAVAHAALGTVGVGLGGDQATALIGVEPARVSNKNGWICVYTSQGGVSVNEYESKIRNIIGTTPYLKRYVDKMNEFFNNAEPYLKKYPKNDPIGFIGYQSEDEPKAHR